MNILQQYVLTTYVMQMFTELEASWSRPECNKTTEIPLSDQKDD